MSRKYIASVLVATMAITGFAARPAAAASEEDIARILAGAATIFIIGKAIQSSRDNDRDDKKSAKKAHSQRHDYKDKPVVIRKHDHKDKGRKVTNKKYDRNDRGRDGHQTRSRGATPLPQSCQISARTRHGTQTLYGARCLDHTYRSARKLPDECRREVRTSRGESKAYSADCLRQRGYTSARY